MIALKTHFSLKNIALWLLMFATSLWICIRVMHYAYPSFNIQGVSMLPSVAPNSVQKAVLSFSSPARHDIYIINTASLTPGSVKHPGDIYIKRIVGTPGDTLVFRQHDGALISINGQTVEHRPAPEFQSFSLTSKQPKTLGATFESHAYWQDIDGKHYPVYLAAQDAFASNNAMLNEYVDVFFHLPWLASQPATEGEITVHIPDGYYFALSDNMVAGTDSRHYGLVPLHGLTHKVIPLTNKVIP